MVVFGTNLIPSSNGVKVGKKKMQTFKEFLEEILNPLSTNPSGEYKMKHKCFYEPEIIIARCSKCGTAVGVPIDEDTKEYIQIKKDENTKPLRRNRGKS